ncbi:MAG: tetratricopeptide repeat protein [Opitutales bacterium]|nr:tetratricopeptide repeat protein [Opitutales bacterium]
MNLSFQISPVFLWRVSLVFALAFLGSLAIAAEEVQFPSSSMERLERYEAHQLGQANQAFRDGEYRKAESMYVAFMSEFPDSTALPFVLLRMGRSQHLDNKRFEAIRTYREVLDFFPNSVRYAAAALFYTGEAHWQNGDEEKALRSWITLAEDEEYREQDVGAEAMNRIGDQFVRQDRWSRAVEYYWQVAINFRDRNRSAARHAMDRVIQHYVKNDPNEERLREFYQKVRGFDRRRPRDVAEDLSEDRTYWGQVNREVDRHRRFGRDEEAEEKAYFRYWAEQMEGRFPAWDDFQIDLAGYHRRYEGDTSRWIARLDDLFERNQEDGDNARILRWMSILQDHPERVEAYYNKLDFEQMSNGEIFDLMRTAYREIENNRMGSNAFGRLRLGEMDDSLRGDVISFLRRHGEEAMVLRVVQSYDDPDRGQRDLLRYYHNLNETEKGVEVAQELVMVPDYAEEAYRRMGEMLQDNEQYQEAIAAYQMLDNAPWNMWRIAECYEAMGQTSQAVQTLRQVENFLEDHASEAALRIAQVYRDAGDREQQVSALRAVLNRYPESSQSRRAHLDLEELGYTRIGGGVQEDD